MKKFIIILLCLGILFSTNLAILKAQTVSDVTNDPIIIDGVHYDGNDYNNLVSFFNQPSAVKGKTNADILNLDINQPNKWSGGNGKYGSECLSHTVSWNKNNPRRIKVVDFFSYKISGRLDLNQFSKLSEIDIWHTKLCELNVKDCSELKEIWVCCSNLNKLTISNNKKLNCLYCHDNKLTKLDVSANIKLRSISCEENNLTELNVSKNKDLRELDCSRNKLKQLNLRINKKLKELNCSGNKLKVLTLSNAQIRLLECRKNLLSKITFNTVNGKTVKIRVEGKGFVGLSYEWHEADLRNEKGYKDFNANAVAKNGAKFIGWMENGKLLSKEKDFFVKALKRDYSLVAKFN